MEEVELYYYQAYIDRVVDGDTYDAEIDLGFRMTAKLRLRLKDVDTPETWRPKTDAEAVHGEAATAFVKEKIEGKIVLIRSHKAGIYNRWEAEVFLEDGSSLGDLLVENDLIKRESY